MVGENVGMRPIVTDQQKFLFACKREMTSLLANENLLNS